MGGKRNKRRLLPQVIAVTGGKGGIGKTNIAVNLGISLIQRGRKVLLFDADLGLGNVDVLLGLKPKKTIEHVFAGEAKLDDVIIEGPYGLNIIPGASGVAGLTRFSSREYSGLIHAFSDLTIDVDTLLVDTSAGISDDVITYASAAQEVILVICDEPTSIADAYALIKLLNKAGIKKFHVVTNMVASRQEGKKLLSKLSRVTEKFLDISLQFLGALPQDNYLHKAVQQRKSVVSLYPSSQIARAFYNLAKEVDEIPSSELPCGHLAFYLERITNSEWMRDTENFAVSRE